MFFQRERDLQIHLATMNSVLHESFEVTFTRREVSLGHCIPDLIYVRIAEMPSVRILPRNTTYRHSHTLWLLKQNGRLSLDRLAALSYDTADRMRQLVTDLIKAGSVIESGGYLRLAPALSDLDCEVVAVEAKMKDWRQALAQAESYQRFADRVFVAMDPIGVPSNPDVIQMFRERSIGLCGVGDDVQWIIYPKRHQRPLGPNHEYLLASALSSTRQQSWSLRYATKASRQA